MTNERPWRTFSIFISSTFADMQAERDHLKNKVFPQVEEELQKRRIRLEIVDLRWGVDTTSMAQEDEREANVLKVCLDEIRRCRPFFIGLLGDRYGWVPPEERMKAAVIGEGNIRPEKGKSVTALEIEFGVLASREQLSRSVFYFRDPLPYEKFPKEKAALFSDACSPDLSEAEKAERKTALEKLKADIRSHFENRKMDNKVKTYHADWTETTGKITGLEAWGRVVYADILAECETHAAETWDQVPQNWQEQELALLDSFINSHTHITTFITEKGEEQVPTFCGRKLLLEELRKHLLSDDVIRWGLALTGESGSGKSAVFSMLHKLMEKEDCLILAHSAGLSPHTRRVADLLKIWNNLLRKELGMEQLMDETGEEDPLKPGFVTELGKALETPFEIIQQQFAELLSMAAVKKRVVLLIDAFDRFESTARAQHLSWLPLHMARNVRLLFTATNGTEQKAVKYHKGIRSKIIDIFNHEEAKEMLNALGRRHHKTLPAGIAKLILEKKTPDGRPAASSPLWLSLAVNILMTIDADDFDKIRSKSGGSNEQIENYLTEMVIGFNPLPGPLFLSLINKAGTVFGENFAHYIFDFLACSRNGLREKDFACLLHNENITWDSLQFTRLRRWFNPHLSLQGEDMKWNLSHNLLKVSLIGQIEESQKKKTHNIIASYLVNLFDDDLKASEAMHHLLYSGNNINAVHYFGGSLSPQETIGAASVLADKIIEDDAGLSLVFSLLQTALSKPEIFIGTLAKYIIEVEKALGLQGNLNITTKFLENIKIILDNSFGNKIPGPEYGYYKCMLLIHLGLILKDAGHFIEATKYFEDSYELSNELNNLFPPNINVKETLYTTIANLADIYQELDQSERALKYLGEALELFRDVHEADPNEKVIADQQNKNSKKGKNKNFESSHPGEFLATIYLKYGETYASKGQIQEALKYFEYYYKIVKDLSESNPSSESYKESLSIAYSKFGNIYKHAALFEEAIDYYKKSHDQIKSLFESNPSNFRYKLFFVASFGEFAHLYFEAGEYGNTLKHGNKALELAEELLKSNPEHEKAKSFLAETYSIIGRAQMELSQTNDALVHILKYHQIIEGILKTNPTNISNKNDLAISYERLGDIYKRKGQFKEALNYYNLRFSLAKELYETNPEIQKLKIGYAYSCSKLGVIFISMNQKEDALSYFERYQMLMKELNDHNPDDVEFIEGLFASNYNISQALRLLNRHKEGLDYYNIARTYIKLLLYNRPTVEKYRNWDKWDYGDRGSQQVLSDLKIETASIDISSIKEQLTCLIKSNKEEQALLLCSSLPDADDEIINIKGICHLRLGHYEAARETFFKLAKLGAFGWRDEAKLAYKINFITSLLLLKRFDAFKSSLGELDPDERSHNYIEILMKSYKQYKEEVSVYRKTLSWQKRLFGKNDSDKKIQIKIDVKPGVVET